ncbi:MAG: AmmeMemoRadiSam system protein B [Anaerolineae bacterium]|nr:AmmeMemoRadiSam system protein B [Anaerolineae bacterium]
MEFLSDARPSPIAGTWYAGKADALSRQMESFFGAVKLKKEDLSGQVLGLMVPHAGHRYSGLTAAYGYQAVADSPHQLVVILSPLHQYFPDDFITTAHAAYRTPLGDVRVAQPELQQLNRLLDESEMALAQVARDGEHSLEIQLPFLQYLWKTPFDLLPVMIRTHERSKLEAFSAALQQTIAGMDALVIASTDLSHFFPHLRAQILDAETLRRVRDFNPQAVLDGDLDQSAPACGSGAVAAMLYTTRLMGADKVQILNYSTSAEATGDESSVVGYGAAAVLKTK